VTIIDGTPITEVLDERSSDVALVRHVVGAFVDPAFKRHARHPNRPSDPDDRQFAGGQ
jgi:hypothetical protein